MQTKAMLEDADELAAQRPALHDRYIASLEEAGTKVSQALHLARQLRHETPPPNNDQRSISFADRVETGRAEISVV